MSAKSTAAGSDGGSLVNRHRELLFNLGLLVGVIVFALGGAFLLLGVTITTTPPAPYFRSTTDRLILIGVSLVAMVVGAGIVRGSLSLGRW
ncbi:hypothetical protein [Haladaptatus salinisoli]|uniref:hypothetical protein n=1 Tax=Haladaptatus salinisoli TaxID=2884876 RepID=UPI001D09CB2A|nr:hypothetical protein [Haladaptatus salinisoli]